MCLTFFLLLKDVVKNIESLTVEKVEDSLESINDITNQLSNALKREKERKDVNTAVSNTSFLFNYVLNFLGCERRT